MWTCLLLLYAQFAVVVTAGTVIWQRCPTNCSCTGNFDAASLTVDCQGRLDVDHRQLSDQLDSMLSGNLTYGRLLTLTITKSLLTHVPRSVCQLTTLRELYLVNNRLARLPDNCLTNLSNLVRFSAYDNAIETLQDGVFDGLTKLQYLYLSWNRISSIGLSVFATSSNLFTLSLSENNLTHVPRSVCQLRSLGYLYLSNNRLTRSSDYCLANLSNLIGFSIAYNAIKTLQAGVFDGLRKLQSVDLSGNRISSIGLSIFAPLSNLSVMILSENNLTDVPRSVCQLRSLGYLYLSSNRLTRLPDYCLTNLSNLILLSISYNALITLQDRVFDGLRQLQYLDLTRNRISSIGFSVFAPLSNLSVMFLSGNNLTQVPRSVCRLRALRHLYLGNNRLTRLPDYCFTNLSNLTWLSISYNALKTLQNGVFNGLEKLQHLLIGQNRLETLQDGVFDGLTKLQYLDLRWNRISSIGLSVFATSSNLSSLYTIHLSGNKLTSLEPWIYDRGLIGSSEKRVEIYLHHNKISKFTNKMGHSRSVCRNQIPYAVVDLRNNRIKHIMDFMNGWQLDFKQLLFCYKITNLVILFGDSLPCDCVDYHFYRMLSLLDRPKADWSENFFMKCNFTDPLTRTSSIVNGFYTDLNLFVCELTERCPAGCVCLHRPSNATLHVYCSNRNFTVLPLELPELPDNHTKYKLDFSNNQLLRRLEHRGYFVNTSILDVTNSSVDHVENWEAIVKIQFLNLFGNNLTSLPPSCLSANITIAALNLANNPWDCSCDNKWMAGCFRSIAGRLTQKVLCYSPYRLRGKNIIQVSDEEFCVDPASEAASQAVRRALIISMSSVAGAVIVLSSVGVIIYRLRVKLYTRWKFHPFDRDECAAEDMEYDVFLSCCENDNLPDGNRIPELLEQRGYRVCHPARDFLPGQPILQDMSNAVERSKRTVCLLTENFRQE